MKGAYTWKSGRDKILSRICTNPLITQLWVNRKCMECDATNIFSTAGISTFTSVRTAHLKPILSCDARQNIHRQCDCRTLTRPHYSCRHFSTAGLLHAWPCYSTASCWRYCRYRYSTTSSEYELYLQSTRARTMKSDSYMYRTKLFTLYAYYNKHLNTSSSSSEHQLKRRAAEVTHIHTSPSL